MRSNIALLPLAKGVAGVAALLPYLALRETVGPADTLVAIGLTLPIAAALLGSAPEWRNAGLALSAVSGGTLVAALLGLMGWPALPFLLLATAETLAASENRRDLVAGALGCLAGVTGGTELLDGSASSAPLGPATALAAAFLALGALGPAAVAAIKRAEAGPAAGPQPLADALALEATGDLVTWHDGAGDVLRSTGACRRLLGLSPHDLAGGGLLERVHVSDRPAYLRALGEVANGAEPQCVTLRLHARPLDAKFPSQVRWAEMRAERLPGRTGPAATVIVVTRDTSAVLAEAEAAEKARHEAERADAMKVRFLANVSHELRTPLNAIIGFSELLCVDHPFIVTDQRRKEYAAIIRDSGHHLLEIVNTLLDISKIETGNLTLVQEPFDMRDLAKSCCELMQLKADEAEVTVRCRAEPGIPDVVADRRACRQILINLLSNAVKFTPAQGIVTVSLSRRTGALLLTVADTGIGIAPADLPRLGDPFFQAGEVHRRRHEGTGLGLSVVRGLVGLHGGTMAIDSGSGIGTTVTISLPIAGVSQERSLKPVAVHTSARMPSRDGLRLSA